MSDLWVFAYGSLMWKPGFPHVESVPAMLQGGHRSLCVYSVVHRGTPLKPGLVLGLDAGGRCHGMAFRVTPGKERETRVYLQKREQATNVYRTALRRVALMDDTERMVRAMCFVVDRRHPQYAGALPPVRQAWLVRHGRGLSGHNVDYLINTVRHLEEMGIHDKPLARLLSLVGARRR